MLNANRWSTAPAAVAVLYSSGAESTLRLLLAELEASTVSVVVCRAPAGESPAASLEDALNGAGFTRQPLVHGDALAAGRCYVISPECQARFEGSRMCVSATQSDELYPLDALLYSLARAWGSRSIVILPTALVADGKRGLLAVRQAGGVVLASRASGVSPASALTRCSVADAPDSEAPPSRPARSRPPASPAFRMPRLFSFSSAMLDSLERAVDRAIESAQGRDRVRVWVPACRAGGLVYAVAMLMRDALARASSGQRVQVFGTDHDEEALAIARAGRYPARLALGMDPRLRGAHTFDEGDTIRIAESLREVCVFSSHKLTRNAPFARIDLLVCQRIFEGLPPSRREDVLAELHFALRGEGVLVALDHRPQFEGRRFELAPEGYLRPRPWRNAALQRDARWSTPTWGVPAAEELTAKHEAKSAASSGPKLELLIRAVGLPLLLLDGAFELLHSSDEAVRAFGLSDAELGTPLVALAPRLPGGKELLHAAERAMSVGATRELSSNIAGRSYLVRVSAGQHAGGKGIAISFSDVSTLETATERALEQRHEQAALLRVAQVALRSTATPELCEEALTMLFANIPVCCAGLIAKTIDQAHALGAVASRGLGDDPLGRVRELSEPDDVMQSILDRASDFEARASAWTGCVEPIALLEGGSEADRARAAGLPNIGAGVFCAILSEGNLLGVIALFLRQHGVEGWAQRSFIQDMASILGAAIARGRRQRRLALELELHQLAASAADILQLGQGLERALRLALGADAIELWTSSTEPPLEWHRAFPATPTASLAPWADASIERSGPLYRPAKNRRAPAELWLPAVTPSGLRAVLRAWGASLREPNRELSLGLERGAPMLAAFLERQPLPFGSTRGESSFGPCNAELEALCASLPVSVSIHDEHGALVRANSPWPSSVPHSGHAAASACFARLCADELPSWIQRVVASGEPVHDLELSLSHAGEARSWLCNIGVIRNLEGVARGATVVLREITPSKRLEDWSDGR